MLRFIVVVVERNVSSLKNTRLPYRVFFFCYFVVLVNVVIGRLSLELHSLAHFRSAILLISLRLKQILFVLVFIAGGTSKGHLWLGVGWMGVAHDPGLGSLELLVVGRRAFESNLRLNPVV